MHVVKIARAVWQNAASVVSTSCTAGLRGVGCSVAAAALLSGPLGAREPATKALPSAQPEASALVVDGPPAPQLPDTIARDDAGRVTIRAVRVREPVRIDGVLDEGVYSDALPASGFIQTVPLAGRLATEQTEVWVFFDDDNLYIGARCWDSAPESDWVANEMRRDNISIFQGDNLGILLDTFYDRRNGIVLNINPLGGRMDGQMWDERGFNLDWNPVWEVRSGRFDGGWTAEVALPFKSVRYRAGQAQVWGLNIKRSVLRLNEHSYLAPLPAEQGSNGLFMASLSAAVIGLEAPDSGRTFEIKPYAVADVTSDPARELSNDAGGALGLDVKYGVTQSLVADLTVNTDFAQVEADEQQVNLTRFSLFFPEKREFFLENQGVFTFGGAGAGAFGGGGTTPVLFYSRQIGLSRGQEVPIDVGGRVTGRAGKFSLGVLNIQTDNAPDGAAQATNFSVVRVRRDVLRRSSIGLLFTGRSISTVGTGSAETYGVDGLFSFFDNLDINTYWAKTTTPGVQDDDISYRGHLDYDGDRYGVQAERLVVGDHFRPDVGFLLRDDFERSFGSFRFSPRPASLARIRKLTWAGEVDYITDRAGVLETREVQGQFGIEFENSDQLTTSYSRSFELLERPFPITSGVTIPVGGYDFQDLQVSYSMGRQRRLAGRLSVKHGSFFSGKKTTVGFSQGRLEMTPRFSLEPSYSYNRVDLAQGTFTTQVARTRTTFTMTPLMFVSGLVQYNSSGHSLSTNLRLRWEYAPGSELFVVYNEDRDTDPLLPDRFSALRNRALVIKINRLFRF
jgi:hypothetical protein